MANKNIIIIPWDYTESCRIALQHAIQLASVVGNSIMLARFLEKPGLFGKKSFEDLKKTEEERLAAEASAISKEFNINLLIAVDQFKAQEIRDLTKDADANLVVCGRTYKTDKKEYETKDVVEELSELDIPFIIAATKPPHDYYKELVVPLDNDKKVKETMQWVVYLAKYYNCNINLFKTRLEKEVDKRDMENNMYFIKKMLDKKNIVYGVSTAKKDAVFETDIIRFAESIDADLVVVMINKYKKILREQPNYDEKLPYLVINRNTEIIKYGGSFR